MDLFKALKEKQFAGLKDYCENVVIDKLTERIYGARVAHLNTLRGIVGENTEIIIKNDDGDKKKKKDDDSEDDSDEKDSGSDDKEDGEKKKKEFPFVKKGAEKDSKNESVKEPEEDDVEVSKDAPKKEKKGKKVTTKDVNKFADASS
jgi:hypothetical protein